MLETIAAGFRTVVGVVVLVVVTLVAAAYVVMISLIKPHNMHAESVIQAWSRMFMGLAPASLEVHGGESLDPNEQYVFVANHLSNFDIPAVLLAIPHRVRFLAKAELFNIPVFSQALRAVGVIRIDRRAGPAAHSAINEGVAAAREHGYSLIIFPEGTRSVDGKLHRFKKGAFRIAIASGLPVVPVTIQGTWEVWKPGAKVFYPGAATVTIHDPIPVDGLGAADIDGLRNRAQEIVGSSYKAPVAGDG
jgi:1-acyl-sn-glycerol-3-phosphate acyltransferase